MLLCWLLRAPAQETPAPAQPPAAIEEVPQTSQAAAAPAPMIETVSAYTISGVVKSGNSLIPGATVTATNPASSEKVVTWTDIDGTFSLQVSSQAKYLLTIEMPAFAAGQKFVLISDPVTRAEMDISLASRAQQPGPANQEGARQQYARNGRGFQNLAVLQAEAGEDGGSDQIAPPGMPVPGLSSSTATESVAFSGTPSGVSMFGMSSDEMQARMRERDQDPFGGGGQGGGGFGGPGGGPPGGGAGAFGAPRGGGRGSFGRGRFDFNKPHGSVYYSANDAALNALPYSLTGLPGTQPGYLQQRFGVNLGGPLNIPKIYNGGSKTFFFFNYNGGRGKNLYDAFSVVPTAGERAGDFSNSTVLAHDASGNPTRQPVQLVYPAGGPCAGQPIPGNNLQNVSPSCPIPGAASNISNGLLNFIPAPNITGAAPGTQNFHFVTSTLNDTDDLNIRVNRALGGSSAGPRQRGPRNNLSFGFHYRAATANITNPFPSVGGTTSSRSFDVPIGYTRTFGKIINNARFDFNRTRIRTQNLYAFHQNIAGDLGITGISNNPFDWGLPNLSFTNFGSLTDTNPHLLRNQTWTFSDSLIWNHGKHTVRWGGDFRRIQINSEADGNPRGTFVFTGAYSGYDLADFLLGLAQQTSVQFGPNQTSTNNYHFRGNSWDLFAQDEWRVRGNLTFNLGLRYEYVSPFTELDNRIANLNVSPSFNPAITPSVVLPGQGVPGSLIKPDRNNFAPRVGIAWKPLNNTVVRAGYGINYNISDYQSIVQNLAFQPPFATAVTNTLVQCGQLTLAAGFPSTCGQATTNTYAVDPNFRLGYVQIWNLDVQQQIRPTLVVNFDYTGTKGTALDILEAPNRTLLANTACPNNPFLVWCGVGPFYWQNSAGSSTLHAGSVRVRKRLQNGFSVGGRYIYSKSLDNASSIGNGIVVTRGGAFGGRGGGSGGSTGSSTISTGSTLVAQNPFDLAAERSLSSFNQTHQFTADYLWQLPFGHDRRWLTGNTVWRAFLGDWNWSGAWTVASGFPFTPRIVGSVADVNQGVNGTLRADLSDEPIAVADPSVNRWFNTAAFVTPPPGQFGNARRNIIIGPGTHVFDMAFTKIIPLKESRMLEVRAQFSNIFNTPQFTTIDTVVNSPTYGRVIAAGAMRSVTLSARFRF
jgi:trimeric autotransporter adhesin